MEEESCFPPPFSVWEREHGEKIRGISENNCFSICAVDSGDAAGLYERRHEHDRGCQIYFLPECIHDASAPMVSGYCRSVPVSAAEERGAFSVTDFFAAAFAVVSSLSYLFSDYKDTAFWGYPGWYMGLTAQLALTGGYFLVSRWYENGRILPGCVWLSAFAVCLTGVLNRTGDDPLHVFGDMSWWDWNRRNLLSTIGNINWFCSYLAVMVPFLIYCFWVGKGYWRLVTGIGAFVGFAALLLQGSSSGYAALAVMLAVLFFGSLRNVSKFLRFLETLLLVPLFGFLMWIFRIDLILPFDVVYHYTPAWGAMLAALIVLYLLVRAVRARGGRDFLESGRVLKAAVLAGAVLLGVGAGIFMGCQLSDAVWDFFGRHGILRFDNHWGNMRGQLWRIAWEGFRDSSLTQKLYGVGPDCFACYFYENYPMDIVVSGQWQEAVYANAHNEWLNMLNNEGILGFMAYTGFFVSAFCRFCGQLRRNRRMMAGMMAVAAYLVNNFFSFGQVVSTPLIFLVIAVCENECRKMDSGLRE